MDIKSEIDKIKWYSNLLNGIVDKYEETPEFFMEEENMESVKLMSMILNKLNEDYSVSINMIKSNLIDKNTYSMEIEKNSNDSDTDSNMSDCSIGSVGSDNFLYNSDVDVISVISTDQSFYNSKCDNEFNKLNLDSDDEDIVSSNNSETIKYCNQDFSQTNTVKHSDTNNSTKENFVNNLLNETINTDNILLYKKISKTDRLSNYLENSYSY